MFPKPTLGAKQANKLRALLVLQTSLMPIRWLPESTSRTWSALTQESRLWQRCGITEFFQIQLVRYSLPADAAWIDTNIRVSVIVYLHHLAFVEWSPFTGRAGEAVAADGPGALPFLKLCAGAEQARIVGHMEHRRVRLPATPSPPRPMSGPPAPAGTCRSPDPPRRGECGKEGQEDAILALASGYVADGPERCADGFR